MQSPLSPSDKPDLRAALRARRQALAPDERQRLSSLAAGHVLDSAAWKDARTVALYMAVRGETDTAKLLESAWATGKEVLLPLCSREKKGDMRFVPCPSPRSLVPGYFGIPEPPPTNAGESAPDLLIVPGVAFSPEGGRLGQGGGYYDRLLGREPYLHSLCLGFAYSFQIVEHLPEEKWDRRVQALATDKGLLWIART